MKTARIAIAPGYGAGWVDLDLDADQPAADITLRPEQVIQGRLFDIQGRPVQGVTVSVEGMGRVPRKPEAFPMRARRSLLLGWDVTPGPPGLARPGDHRRRGPLHHPRRGPRPPGHPHGRRPRFARQRIMVDTDSTSGSKSVTTALEPAKVITGRITYADTGKPVPHAVARDPGLYRMARATATNSRPMPRGPTARIPCRRTATTSRLTPPMGSLI